MEEGRKEGRRRREGGRTGGRVRVGEGAVGKHPKLCLYDVYKSPRGEADPGRSVDTEKGCQLTMLVCQYVCLSVCVCVCACVRVCVGVGKE